MKMLSSCFLAAVLFITGATFAGAQEETRSAKDTGKVKVSVNPEEAYIWVDGKPMSHRSSSLTLPVGEHKIAVYNYGYMPQVHNVTVASGQTKDVEAKLKPVDAKVSGPWGRIQVEGVPGNALVFLNGTTPEFFVG